MKRLGTVVVENGKRYVEYDKHENCKGCGACDGSRRMTVSENYSPGSRVEAELPDDRVIPAATLAYVFPLAGMILGLFLGYLLGEISGGGNTEMWSAVSGVVCSAMAYGVLRMIRVRVTRFFRAEIKAADELPTEGIGKEGL